MARNIANNHRRRNQKWMIFFLMFLLCLPGCMGKDGEIYGQEEVLEYVDSICSEPYELVGKELIQEEPDNMEYTFRTTDRDLTFRANSYLSPIWIDATQTSFYRPELSCDYVSVVCDLYREEVREVLRADEGYLEEYGWIYLLSFQDIGRVVETVLAADQVYRQELAYNSLEFLAEHSLTSIHLVWQRSPEEAEEHSTWVNLADVGITGQHDRQELYDRLANAYAQLCVDGKIANAEGVPAEYLEGKHVSLLPEIWLNGAEMLYDSEENPYGPYGLTTDDYKYCWYSAERESYMMVLDIGLISDRMSFPLINREYVQALGGTYHAEAEGDVYTSTWTIGADTWTLRAEYDDNEIRSLEAEKNGQPLELPYITVEDDFHVSATFCVGVTVEDFGRLFGLDGEVREEEGRVEWKSTE